MAHTFLRAPYHILTTTKSNTVAKPHCYPAKTGYGCPSPCPPETDECPNHPDLYLLRDAAADERGAIADYLACAAETCLDEIFPMLPKMRWSTMRKRCGFISWLDPVQAEMLAEEARRAGNETADRQPKWATAKKLPGSGRMSRSPRQRFARRSMHHQGHTR